MGIIVICSYTKSNIIGILDSVWKISVAILTLYIESTGIKKRSFSSDSNGTARIDQIAGAISCNVTVQRYITAKTARKYSFLGCPVNTSIRNGWQQQVYITGAGTGGTVCGSTTGNGVNVTDKYNSNGFDVTQIDSATSIVLKDKFLNTIQDVRMKPNYNFNITADTASQGGRRFELLLERNKAPLPITFEKFTSTVIKDAVAIEWKVAKEVGISRYEVERSTDAINFNTIASIKSTGKNDYTINDNQPSTSTIYYRIKAINNDGTLLFSNTFKLTTHHYLSQSRTRQPKHYY